MSASPSKVLFDMDMGVDDALAMLLALNCPELDIVGMSTVSGNISAEQALLNSQFLTRQFGLGGAWPIECGESVALNGRKPDPVPEIHGIDGLGGIRAPQGDTNLVMNQVPPGQSRGVQLMLAQAKAYRGQLRIIATGPLTNVARAIQADKSTMDQIEGLHVMGGALDVKGNMPPDAEFNVHCDPEALDVVLKSGIPVTLYPLDVTEKVRMLYSDLNAGLRLPEAELALLQGLTRVYSGFHLQTARFDGCFVHDVHPVLGLVQPSIFEYRRQGVSVETKDPKNLGKVSWVTGAGSTSQVKVAVKVESNQFMDFYWSRLREATPHCRYPVP